MSALAEALGRILRNALHLRVLHDDAHRARSLPEVREKVNNARIIGEEIVDDARQAAEISGKDEREPKP
jgi:hypothetical protein